MESFAEIWPQVLNNCRSKISEVAYKTWLSKISAVSLKDGEATLHISSPFQRNIIVDTYSELLSTAFEEELGFSVKITFLTDEDSLPSGMEVKKVTKRSTDYDYTFDTFIVGSSNRFAHAASLAVADNPSVTYNPLFIYGNSGLGKTHLLNAIYNRIKANHPDKTLLYIRSEDFTIELINAIKSGTTSSFHDKYRTVDVFLVDDVQFIAGKESTQEEFFNTFNALYNSNKQMVLTSDRPPRDIATLDDRIRSRFESGLIADIQPPEFETRVGIILRKAQILEIQLPDNIVFYIAEQVKTNIRQLEGIVKKLKAYSSLNNEILSLSTAQNAIRDIRNDDQPEPITVEKIVSEVSRTYNIPADEIRGKKRNAPISYARQVCIYVIREITQMPVVNIGNEFGINHSTVIYSLNKVEDTIKNNSYEKSIINDIIKNIQSNNN